MKKFEIVYGSMETDIQKLAVEELTKILLDYTFEYPVCRCAEENEELRQRTWDRKERLDVWSLLRRRKTRRDFYNSAVCVSPGNVGLTAIHSLTFGCPVITHDNFTMQMPEFEAIKEGVTGSFFKENDPKDLTSKIEFWIGKNEEERELVRTEAFKEIDRKWNVDSQIETLKNLFKKLNGK